MGTTAPRDVLLDMLSPVVEQAGFDLEDVSVTPAGKRRVVRVIVDKDGGVALDDIASVSRPVSDALDSTDALGDVPYVLEVSSPGVDRPLREPRHWRRARGRVVKVILAGGGEVTGRVVESSDSAAVLEPAPGQQREVDYADVARAHVQVEFSSSVPTDEDDNDTSDGEA